MKDESRTRPSAGQALRDSQPSIREGEPSVGKLAANRLLDAGAQRSKSERSSSVLRARFETLREDLPLDVRNVPVMLPDGSVHPKSLVDERRLERAGLTIKYSPFVSKLAGGLYDSLTISHYEFQGKSRQPYVEDAIEQRCRFYQELATLLGKSEEFFHDVIEMNVVLRETGVDPVAHLLPTRYQHVIDLPEDVRELADGPEKTQDPMKFDHFPTSCPGGNYRLIEERLKDFAHDMCINLALRINTTLEKFVENNLIGLFEFNGKFEIAKFHYFELRSRGSHGHNIIRHDHSLHNAKLLTFDEARQSGEWLPEEFDRIVGCIPGLADQARVLTGILTDQNEEVVYSGDPCVCVGNFALVGWTTEEASKQFYRRLFVRRVAAEKKTALSWSLKQVKLLALHFSKLCLTFSKVLFGLGTLLAFISAGGASLLAALGIPDGASLTSHAVAVAWVVAFALVIVTAGITQSASFMGLDLSTIALTEDERRRWKLGKGQ